MSNEIFKMQDVDLVNLQSAYKKAPKQFTRVVKGVLDDQATGSRGLAVKNIEGSTITRSKGKSFADKSIWATRAKYRSNLNQMESSMFSVDLSKAGRSSGFEELEHGTQYHGYRVPTIASRGAGEGNKSKVVSKKLRMDKRSTFHKHKHFKGKTAKTKKNQVAAMLRMVRNKTAENKPMVIPTGLDGKLGRMPPGIYKLKSKGSIKLVNPFRGKRAKTKKIAWAEKAAQDVMADPSLRESFTRNLRKQKFLK